MKKIVLFVEEVYEDLELWYPKLRLQEEGFQTVVAGPVAGHIYTGKHGYPCKADISFKDAASGSFDAVVIPGGFAPDRLRRSLDVLHCVKEMFSKGRPVAFICHGGWVPISAKIVKGRKVTGTVAIKDDLENAGAIWMDQAVVVDGNLISSRTPADLAVFAKSLVEQLK
ncbi:MAG: type 1 glutamine amidotransferase [Verrucomicrobia bacterium]|nr:type 1 glutamine amidotransferase [Verrucomicrobiota bacterium]